MHDILKTFTEIFIKLTALVHFGTEMIAYDMLPIWGSKVGTCEACSFARHKLNQTTQTINGT